MQQCTDLSLGLYCLGPEKKTQIVVNFGYSFILKVSRGERRENYREEGTQTINLLWVLWSSILVQSHHEPFAVKEDTCKVLQR